MHLYRTTSGNIIVQNNQGYLNNDDFDILLNHDKLHEHLLLLTQKAAPVEPGQLKQMLDKNLLPPISKAGSMGSRSNLSQKQGCKNGRIKRRRRRRLLSQSIYR
jgi:hypothetical protein